MSRKKEIVLSEEFKRFTADLYGEYVKLGDVKEDMGPHAFGAMAKILRRLSKRAYRRLRDRCYTLVDASARLDEMYEAVPDDEGDCAEPDAPPQAEAPAPAQEAKPDAAQQTPAPATTPPEGKPDEAEA
jgi:hypothetical protein